MKTSLNYEINNKTPGERKRFIRELFNSIVPNYDLLNHLLSFGIDLYWRKKTTGFIERTEDIRAIDLCCGTGDLSKLLQKKTADVVSLDFSIKMIQRGISKKSLLGYPVVADASVMPFADNAFNLATIAFGIRNIPDMDNFLNEVKRILMPGGELLILELVRPQSRILRYLYPVYLNTIVTPMGGVISGSMKAYRYLSRTISTFIDPLTLQGMLKKHGFTAITLHPLTFGVAAIIVCKKDLK